MKTDGSLISVQTTLYESRNPSRRWLHRRRRDWVSSVVRKFAAGRTRALEVGPGSGVYVPLLCELFREVWAADCEEEYLDYVRDRFKGNTNLQFVVDDITRSALPSARFDLVLCTEVIEHIADSQSALKSIRRVLSNDGVLVLTTPQRFSSLELTARLALSPALIWLTRLVYREPVLEMGHINLMTEGRVVAQLESAGFRVIEKQKTGLYLPGIAELGGKAGQRAAQWLEPRIRGTALDWLLWTQCFIASPT